MGLLKMAHSPVCSSQGHCAQWARVYLKYCLCNAKDGASLALGVISVLSWGVAEVPQIMTNFREKSTEGLSIAFLMTWIIGDLFNLGGCLLEPATLPTQLYMAVLYTATTTLLTGQTLYYGHIYQRLKASKRNFSYEDEKAKRPEIGKSELSFKSLNDCRRSNLANEALLVPSSPLPVSPSILSQAETSHGANFYYMSARSLSRSPKPAAGTFLANSHDLRLAPPRINDQHFTREPLLNDPAFLQSASPVTKNMLSVAISALLFLGVQSLQLSGSRRFNRSSNNMVILVGRKLLNLEDRSLSSSEYDTAAVSSGVGSFLGWAMAAIYMGGRLPQIFLNIKRGTAEGLNPLMFCFALVGNSTYVASILVSSVQWSKVRPNLPWLVDAGGCIFLDTFILIQFVYFRWRRHKSDGGR